jgi:hypothetical protein
MKMNEKVLLELKKLGLMPEEHEGNILFRYQMLSYLYLKDDDDENYYALYMPCVQEVTEENECEVLKVMNECNNSMKSVKLVNNDGQVWIGYELRLPPDADLSELVEYTVRGLYGAKMKFDMEMKGL